MKCICLDHAPLAEIFVSVGRGDGHEDERKDRDYLGGDWIQGE
jgi:hypothetical protein